MAGGRISRYWGERTVCVDSMTSSATRLQGWFQGLCCFAGTRPCSLRTPSSFMSAFRKPLPVPRRSANRVVVAAEPVTSIDVTSADMLAELERELVAAGIELHFAEMKDPVKDKLKRFELFERFGTRAFHPTIGAAVDAYLADHGVAWKP